MLSGMDRLEKLQQEKAWDLVEQRLELTVLYAIGDACGPSVNYVKIGVSTSKAYRSEIKCAAVYRHAPLVTRYEGIISGRGKAEAIKGRVLHELSKFGCDYQSWRIANERDLEAIVGLIARKANVRIMTREEAEVLRQATFDEIAARIAAEGVRGI